VFTGDANTHTPCSAFLEVFDTEIPSQNNEESIGCCYGKFWNRMEGMVRLRLNHGAGWEAKIVSSKELLPGWSIKMYFTVPGSGSTLVRLHHCSLLELLASSTMLLYYVLPGTTASSYSSSSSYSY